METTAEWTTETDRAPEAGKPEAGKPEAGKPEAGKPEAGKPEGAEQPEQHDAEGAEGAEDAEDAEDGAEQTSSISELRAEAARYRRQRSELREQVEQLQQQLFTERVRSTGLMIDPADMPVNAELLDSPDELRQHVEDYVQQRPHLRRRQFPQIGVHEQGRAAGPSLADILRNHA